MLNKVVYRVLWDGLLFGPPCRHAIIIAIQFIDIDPAINFEWIGIGLYIIAYARDAQHACCCYLRKAHVHRVQLSSQIGPYIGYRAGLYACTVQSISTSSAASCSSMTFSQSQLNDSIQYDRKSVITSRCRHSQPVMQYAMLGGAYNRCPRRILITHRQAVASWPWGRGPRRPNIFIRWKISSEQKEFCAGKVYI